jgi:hypothetical protein
MGSINRRITGQATLEKRESLACLARAKPRCQIPVPQKFHFSFATFFKFNEIIVSLDREEF